VKSDARRARHELLELLYNADEKRPGTWRYIDFDRSDPGRGLRVREADRLKKEGLIEGSIGGDGAMQVRITHDGRDHVESDAFDRETRELHESAPMNNKEPSWLACYKDWLLFRELSRGTGPVDPNEKRRLDDAFARLDRLLEFDIDDERRSEIAQWLSSSRVDKPDGDHLRMVASRLADPVGLVLSDPNIPLSRPRLDRSTYIRLVRLAARIDEHEHSRDDDLWALQLATRSTMPIDHVHAAIATMLADGVAYLPVKDDARADAFRLGDENAITAVLHDSSTDEDIEFEPDVQSEDKVEPDKRNVFIVHGRDVARNSFFFDLLRQLDLHPLEFDELIAMSGSGSPYIGDVVRLAFDEAQAVLVLFTGDDLAHLRTGLGESEEPKPQPRPNVLFEAGMAIALQRDRTIIVEVPSLRGLSDLHGIHVLRFSTGSAEERQKLVTRLRTAGCEPNTSGTDWLTRPVFPQ
jgi:predicted nucleotide-binding protein